MGFKNEVICAPATASGGALSVVRLSGDGSIELTDKMFRKASKASSNEVKGSSNESNDVKVIEASKGSAKRLAEASGNTLHYGDILEADGSVVDDVVVSVFRAPHSFTGEDGVEISCHGSGYIVQRIIELAIDNGARMATAGEFTTRAFMAGRIDLSQAEAVADMIGVSDRATHRLAQMQMRGGYSERLEEMRAELLRLGALLELELDFSEEDVEFANRGELQELVSRLITEIERLRESFMLGNAIKRGVAVAIVGAPNAGKSTLLNRLLGEDRAMVSAVAGTTRDSIEECVAIDGITYRFIDTAGLHESDDELERMGMERTHKAMSRADIVIQLIDIEHIDESEPLAITDEQRLIRALNKIDKASSVAALESAKAGHSETIFISAKSGEGVDELRRELGEILNKEQLYRGDLIVSNTRHYEHLTAAAESLHSVAESQRCNLPSDLIASDLSYALEEIGAITGAITNDDILDHIFSHFCIGK
ncbi:MAG: tRNA uridine-5-carboxymethylaminomethyl(34) synthesis GTPase MnmE [Rikenellaceae bacterium]